MKDNEALQIRPCFGLVFDYKFCLLWFSNQPKKTTPNLTTDWIKQGQK